MTTPKELKALAEALGLNIGDVPDKNVDVLNAIAESYEGEGGAETIPEAVQNITEVAGNIGSKPEGTINITENGNNIDVAQYATANVAVPASAVVSGTKSITENGTGIDVTNYAAVDVAVPSANTPTVDFYIKNDTGLSVTVSWSPHMIDYGSTVYYGQLNKILTGSGQSAVKFTIPKSALNGTAQNKAYVAIPLYTGSNYLPSGKKVNITCDDTTEGACTQFDIKNTAGQVYHGGFISKAAAGSTFTIALVDA